METSPSAKFDRVQGSNIILVPGSLLVNSIQELYLQIDMGKNELGFVLRVQSTKETGKRTNVAKLRMGERVETVDINTMRMEKHEATRIAAAAQGGDLRGLSKYIFITQPQAYPGSMRKTSVHTIPCGRWVRDEFHQEHGIDNHSMTAARELIVAMWGHSRHRQTTKILLMSGTPFRLSVADAQGISSLWSLCHLLRWEPALRKHAPNLVVSPLKMWQMVTADMKNEFWRSCTPSAIQTLKAKWTTEKANCRYIWASLIRAVMIQRSWGSRWFDGKVLLELPRMNYHVVSSTLDYTVIRKISQNLFSMSDTTMTSGQRTSLAVKAKKCASFPAFADLAKDKTINFKFGKEWMDAVNIFKTLDSGRDNPFHQYRKDIEASSSKLPLLGNILDEQLRRKDFLGRKAKGIVFTEYNETAASLYLWVMGTYQEKWASGKAIKAVLIYGGMPKAERQSAAHEFQNGDKIDLLIGVASAMGTGLTLTRALFSVLFEQQGDPGQQKQMIGRMLRNSNYNWHGLYVFEMFVKNYGPDRNSNTVRKGRADFGKSSDAAIVKDLLSNRDGLETSDESVDGGSTVRSGLNSNEIRVKKDPRRGLLFGV